MTDIKSAAVPDAILALIQDPPLLKGESRQEYFDLLGALASDVVPTDIVEWLWLIQFSDCTWEIFRDRRFRAFIVDLQRGNAHGTLILNEVPKGPGVNMVEYNRRVARCKENPDNLREFGIDPQAVPAIARVHAAARLELIDKSLERLYRRCDSILQQLEYRREVFAHRALRAADKVLKVENVQSPNIVPDVTPPAIEPPNPAQTDQSPMAPDQTATTSEMPDAGGTSPEVSEMTPSSDVQN